jgi:glycosyltransferase involved in cell wall biosynthesis
MKFSIVIPTYNSEKTIKKCLDSVFSQKRDCEVIIVDNASNDNTLEIVQGYSVKLVKLDFNYGPSFARNRGVSLSEGDVVIFLDSDCVLGENSLDYFAEDFNKGFDIVQGTYDFEIPKDLGICSFTRNSYKVFKLANIEKDYVSGLNSYCFAIRKDVFVKNKGFDVLRDCVEDVELGLRLIKNGYKIFLDRRIKVVHLKKYNFISLLTTDYKKVFNKTRLMLDLRKERKKVSFSLNSIDKVRKEIISLFLSPLIFISFLLGFVYHFLWYIGIGFMLLFVWLSIEFLSFILKRSNFMVLIRAFVIYYFEILSSFLAFVSAIILSFWNRINIDFYRIFKKIFITKNTLPEQITFFITNKCNLKCKHCFYWNNLNKCEDFNIDEFKIVAKNIGKFRFASITGGEPFLRDDIDEIVKTIVEINKVKRISIPTNGFLTDRVVELTGKILKAIDNKSRIIVKVSLDGTKDIHNQIRGDNRCFDNAINTLKKLKKLSEENNNLKVGVLMTFFSLNANDLKTLYEWVMREISPNFVSLNLVRGDLKNDEIKNVDLTEYNKLYERIEKDFKKKDDLLYLFYSSYKNRVRRVIFEVIKNRKYPFRCYAGRLSCVVDEKLNVFACEALKKSIGNLREFNYDFTKLWFSKNADEIRRYIDLQKCICHNECNIQINSFFSIKELSGIVFNILKFKGEKLCELH